MSVPSIAVVTPSYNQAPYLEATMRSVLDQNYPALEYVVMDGGSADGSVEIIRRYEKQLAYWTSGRDGGQYHAIERGFAKTSAEIMGWLNSDDLHCPWTLAMVGQVFSQFPEVDWLTTRFPLRFDAAGRAVFCRDLRGFSQAAFGRGEYLPGTPGFFAGPLQQESTFWRRSLWNKAGGMFSPDFDYAADFELWCRFAKLADPVAISVPLAGFRRHGDQKTGRDIERYRTEAREAFERHYPDATATSPAIRNFCRDRLPAGFRSMALRWGGLFTGRVITHHAEAGALVLEEIVL